MAEKAICAPIDGTLITRAAFVPEDREYRMCTHCVMDTTDPEITFDDEGVCSHCSGFEHSIKPYWPRPEEGAVRLEKMIAMLKDYGRGKRYDCIIGLSGGVDSSYAATKVVEWGLRPLAVHVDAGWNSELAVKNIEEICRRLGVDLVTHVVDWEDMRDMQLAFLRSHVANQDVPQDHAFFAALYHYATKEGIQHVIEGRNYATESILPTAWGYDAMDADHVRDIHRHFGENERTTFPIVGFFDLFIKYPRIHRMRSLAPLNLMPYSKAMAIEVLERDFGWRYYGGKHYESRWTRFFQAYYLPYKFGYDKRKAHYSSMIVSGQMTREEALRELAQPLYDERLLSEDKEFIAKKLRISIQELESLIAAPPRHYTEFKHNSRKKFAYRVAHRLFWLSMSPFLAARRLIKRMRTH